MNGKKLDEIVERERMRKRIIKNINTTKFAGAKATIVIVLLVVTFIPLYLVGIVSEKGILGYEIDMRIVVGITAILFYFIADYTWKSWIRSWLTKVEEDKIIVRGKQIPKNEITKIIVRAEELKFRSYNPDLSEKERPLSINIYAYTKKGEKIELSFHIFEDLLKYDYPIKVEEIKVDDKSTL